MKRTEVKVGEEYLATTAPNDRWLNGSDWRADRVRVLDTTGWKKANIRSWNQKKIKTEAGKTVTAYVTPGGTGLIVEVLNAAGKPTGEIKTVESRYLKDTWASAEQRIALRKASNEIAQVQEVDRRAALEARQEVVLDILAEHGIKARGSHAFGYGIVLDLEQAEALVHSELRVKEF